MLGLQALLAASATATVGIVTAQEVEISGREIRLGDVASLRELGAPTRARLASRVIALLPRGRNSVTLSRAALAGLVGRSVPALSAVPGADESPVTIRTTAKPTESARPSCVALSRPVAEGEALTVADVAAAPCDKPERSHVRFDRTGSMTRAAADLPAGTPLGRLTLPEAAGVDRGDSLTLISTIGPVRIQRKVVAVQPGRAGSRIFVQDQEGQVLTVPLQLVKSGEGAQ